MPAHYRKNALKCKTFYNHDIYICKEKNLPRKKIYDRILISADRTRFTY